jgi:hypothetical protein
MLPSIAYSNCPRVQCRVEQWTCKGHLWQRAVSVAVSSEQRNKQIDQGHSVSLRAWQRQRICSHWALLQ